MTSPPTRPEIEAAWLRHYEARSRRRHAVAYGQRTTSPIARQQRRVGIMIMAMLLCLAAGLVAVALAA